MTKIDASKYVGKGFPPDEGKNLAIALLKLPNIDWDDLQIDVSGLASVQLISAFFNGFLQEVFEREHALLDKARHVRWHVRFPFQETSVGQWMSNFKPQHATA